MKTIDFSYFIERYNAGNMSDTEKHWFTKELDANEMLRREVHLRKSTDEVLKNQDIISLRSKLSGIEEKRATNRPLKNSKKPAYLEYAAAIAVLVIIGSITLFSGINSSSTKIIDRYYKAYEPPTNQRSGKSEKDADYRMALECYNTHDYQNAAIFFNKVLESNPEDMQSLLLNGVSYFEAKKYPEAKQSFVNVINNKDNLFIESAKWHLAWCYIKTNDNTKAIQQFEIINKEGGIYKKAAKKIIRKLK